MADHLRGVHALWMTGEPDASAGNAGQSAVHRTVAGGQSGFSAQRSRSESVRLILAGALAALALAFAVLNVRRVEVDWILTTSKTPLIVVIAVSLLVGAVLGYVIARRSAKAASNPSPRKRRA
jgi:uncharacterized integral membrane protein